MIDNEAGNSLQTASVALQTLALGAVLVCFSLLHISLGGRTIRFEFIPLALLFFWPRNSRFGPAIWAVLAIGLLQDLVSGGPLGLWTLTYTILFVVIDPTVRRSRGGLLSQWSVFALLIATGATLMGLLGWASVGEKPGMWALCINGAAATALFPVLFGLRKFVYQVTGRNDAAGAS